MAYTDYTPDATNWSDTVPEPDDAQFQADGTAAFNTSVEQLADNIAYVGQAGTFVRNVAYAVPEATTGAVLNVDSVTSTDWQDIPGCSKTVATKPNDRVVALVMCDTDLGNPGTHYIDLSHAQASAAEAEFSGCLRLLEGTERKGHTLIGAWQATNDENVTVKLRGKAAAGDFSVYGGVVMIVFVVAQRSTWP